MLADAHISSLGYLCWQLIRLSASWAIDSEPIRAQLLLEPEWALSHRGREGERNNCVSKIQLVGKKYRDKTTLASKTQFSCHCFGFQSRRFRH